MKLKRIIALLLILTLSVGSVYYYTEKNDISFGSAVKSILSNQDKAMAENIADITGESVGNIMKLRAESKSWNNVLDTLQSKDGYDKFMTDDELEELLSKEKFDSQSVLEIKSLAEQVYYNLKEISDNEDINITPPKISTESGIESQTDDAEEYKKLAPVYDKNLAVYLSLKLEDKFGSLQQTMDEYLYCLQVNVDLRVCLLNEKEYDKLILEKAAVLMREDAITVQSISEYLILKIQRLNSNDKKAVVESSEKDNILYSESLQVPTMNNTVPQYQDTRPKVPTAEIIDEISNINNKWMNE